MNFLKYNCSVKRGNKGCLDDQNGYHQYFDSTSSKHDEVGSSDLVEYQVMEFTEEIQVDVSGEHDHADHDDRDVHQLR